MKTIVNTAVKQWDKMVKAWKHNNLATPLNELFTYCNYMANGHYSYLIQFKDESTYNQHLSVLREFLKDKYIDNLIEAKKIFDSYKDKKELKEIEEEVFKIQDESYFEDVGFVESIIFDRLYNGEQVGFQTTEIYKWFSLKKGRLYVKLHKKKLN